MKDSNYKRESLSNDKEFSDKVSSWHWSISEGRINWYDNVIE